MKPKKKAVRTAHLKSTRPKAASVKKSKSKHTRSKKPVRKNIVVAKAGKGIARRESRNGIQAPLRGMAKKIWAICSAIRTTIGRPPIRSEMLAETRKEKVSDHYASNIFDQWRNFHGVKPWADRGNEVSLRPRKLIGGLRGKPGAKAKRLSGKNKAVRVEKPKAKASTVAKKSIRGSKAPNKKPNRNKPAKLKINKKEFLKKETEVIEKVPAPPPIPALEIPAAAPAPSVAEPNVIAYTPDPEPAVAAT